MSFGQEPVCEEKADRGRHVTTGPLPCCEKALALRAIEKSNAAQPQVTGMASR